MRVMCSARQPIRRACSARASVRGVTGALVCAGVIGLAAIGVATASPAVVVAPTAPTAPTVVAPTLPVMTPPLAPVVAEPVPVSWDSIANALGESLNLDGQASAIEQAVDALLAAGSGGEAGQLPRPACAYPPAAQAFLAWGDGSSYALAPDGDFAWDGAWTLNSQASIVDGADPYSGAERSLQLTAGGQAVSPAMCVNVNEPTIRFFLRDLGGNGDADVRVDVVYEGKDGSLERLTIARVTAAASWHPSPSIPILVNTLAATSARGETAVAFAFTAEGLSQNETIGISALYVDPFQSL
jgi:hypothetical protein